LVIAPVNSRFQRNARASAFTLMELMVVLVLIGIMSAMIIPEMRGTYEDARLRSASRDLLNVFDLAYSRAISLRQTHRVRLDRINSRYFIEKSRPEGRGKNVFSVVQDIPGGEGEIDRRISMEVRKTGEDLSVATDQPPTQNARDGMPSQDSEDAIAFYPDGTADAREIWLEDREGFRLALRINATTARVQIVELEHK
jgi:prepilin-type N-terminal cleavage/methylation domain-containing protein